MRRFLRSLAGRISGKVLNVLFAAPMLVAAPLVAIVTTSSSVALAEQSVEQCRKCCEESIHDEYYKEQCRLKCFRNPDYCSKGGGSTEAQPVAKPEPKPERKAKSRVKKRSHKPRKKPRTRTVRLRWPNPLNLTPGKEIESAARILDANGINPQDQRNAPALQAVTAVLIDFVAKHPQGGELPTNKLKKIILPYK